MLTWSTDIHLDHVTAESAPYQSWIAGMTASESPLEMRGALLTGDLADANCVIPWLEQVARDSKLSVYFVLGNHDYYHGSIKQVRDQMSALDHPQLIWLDRAGPVKLSDSTSLVGVGGWGDGRVGDFLETPIRLNDHRLIEELTISDRATLLERLRELGLRDARALRGQLERVETPHVIVATHVPPFRESTWYYGRYGDWDWMPDFCCGAVGEVLLEYARAHPNRELNVYCGHSHGEGSYHPLDNLSVFTGRAEYGHPQVQGTIDERGRVTDAARYPQA